MNRILGQAGSTGWRPGQRQAIANTGCATNSHNQPKHRPCPLADHLEGRKTKSSDQPIVSIRGLQQQSPAVGTPLALIELGNDWLAKNSWNNNTALA